MRKSLLLIILSLLPSGIVLAQTDSYVEPDFIQEEAEKATILDNIDLSTTTNNDVKPLSNELTFSPSVSVEKLPSAVPSWTWTSSGVGDRVFRYRLDDGDYVETSDMSFTPEANTLKPGNHTLYVQEKINGYWSQESSATTVIFPLDVSGTDYLKNLPTATAHTELLPLIIRFLITLGGLLAFVSFIYSGIWMIIFADHEDEVSKMKRNLIFSVIGLAMIGLAYSIVAGILKLI